MPPLPPSSPILSPNTSLIRGFLPPPRYAVSRSEARRSAATARFARGFATLVGLPKAFFAKGELTGLTGSPKQVLV